MLARIPTGPDPPRGWQDEGVRMFGAREMRRMRLNVSNDNDAPPGRESVNEADETSDSQADQEEGEDPSDTDDCNAPSAHVRERNVSKHG